MNRKMGKLGFGMTILAVVVCLVIVTGSTFSLFTTKDKDDITIDSANVELIAKIDEASLALYSKGVAQTGKFENGGTATFTNKNHTLTFENIAPGDKATFNIVVTNESTIDIQYRIKWIYEGTLGEALVATVDGKALASTEYSEWAKWTPSEANTKTLELAFELPITANDDYQNKSASISFVIEAVQANGIQDSDVVTTADQLYVALEMNGFAVLGADIQLADTLTLTKDATLYLAGYTLTNANGDAIVNNANLTIYEGSPVQRYSVRRNAQSEEQSVGAIVSLNGSAIVNNGTLTINGGSFKGTEAAAVVNTAEAVELVVEAGSFVATFENEEDEQFAIEYAATENVTLNGGTFTGETPEDINEVLGEGLNATPDEDGNIVIAPAPITTVTTAEEFMAALENAQKGETIIADGVSVDINAVGTDMPNGKRAITIKGGITIKGLTILGSYRGGNFLVFEGGADEQVVLENCTLEPSGRAMGIGLHSINNGVGSVVCNNCTFKGPVTIEFEGNSATFNNCTFTKHTTGNHYLMAYGGTQTYNGCTFDYTGVAQTSMGTINTGSVNACGDSDGSVITVVILDGCTFINCGRRTYGTNVTFTVK